jgi:hypothetical protein
MERTNYKKTENNLPDAINCSIPDNFTQVPNDLLRNPNITGKAKAILCLLLSNQEGWHSCIEGIKMMMKEQRDAIRSGLTELEESGYLKRIYYRDKIKKTFAGSLWAYTNTPFQFLYEKEIKMIEANNLEVFDPKTGNPVMGISVTEKPTVIIPIEKIPNIKRTRNISLVPKKLSTQERNETYLQYSTQLSEIIQTTKNITHKLPQLKQWANDIRILCSQNNIEPDRIQKVLDWYSIHVGGQYTPVIESGSALREKFAKLENAMERDKNQNNYKNTPKYKLAKIDGHKQYDRVINNN